MSLDRVQSLPPELSDLRGRSVCLGPTLDVVLGQREYPVPVAKLLGEALLLAVALAATLKYDGVFTLQIKGDGPVSLIIADVVAASPPVADDEQYLSHSVVRGTARFNPDLVARMTADPYMPPLALLGKGWLAFTVDQGGDTERYQGIVALRGTTLAACLQHYFQQSEQVPTAIRLSLDQRDGFWSGSAALLQRLPGQRGAEDVLLEQVSGAMVERLFDQEAGRLIEVGAIRPGCRCSRERVAATLRALDRTEIESLRDDGAIRVTCEFCNTTYSFDEQQLAEAYAA